MSISAISTNSSVLSSSSSSSSSSSGSTSSTSALKAKEEKIKTQIQKLEKEDAKKNQAEIKQLQQQLNAIALEITDAEEDSSGSSSTAATGKSAGPAYSVQLSSQGQKAAQASPDAGGAATSTANAVSEQTK